MGQKDYLADRPAGGQRFSPEEAQLFRQPDVVCVEEYMQVYRAKPPETPERRLVAAILRDAIDCYLRDCCAENRHKKSSFRDAEEWFFSADDYDVFSLENICGVLNINPGYIRKSLLSYQQNHRARANSQAEKTREEPSAGHLRLAS